MIKGKSSQSATKYWIHKFDKNLLRQLDQNKTLGAEKKRSSGIRPVSADDKIIIFSTLDIDSKPTICFIAYTMVDETFKSNETLYKKYHSQKKLKLKGIKYFNDPVIAKDLAEELVFIKDPKKQYNYLKSVYREISENDFKSILLKTSRSPVYPSYFEKLSFTMDEFILNSINSLFYVLKNSDNRKQIEIKTFIKLLTHTLNLYGVSKDFDEVKEFYSKNVWKQGFNHKTSRDPDKLVDLYDKSGKKRDFSYITLE